ncbi:MAG TPA: winged helix-turn-helix domain-containing protein, partial [Acidobacteriaceae bacterium]|nr:winged helix-turn-helix domain-containing protein [Acidobacteriaceae bacterium]
MPSSTPSQSRISFGLYEVDLQAGELWRSGYRVKLQSQPFKVLTVLLERPGEVVTREELQARLWGTNTIVDFDHSLATAINKIREALRDSAENPRFVETLARRGYRFIAPVSHPREEERQGPAFTGKAVETLPEVISAEPASETTPPSDPILTEPPRLSAPAVPPPIAPWHLAQAEPPPAVSLRAVPAEARRAEAPPWLRWGLPVSVGLLLGLLGYLLGARRTEIA